MVPNKNQVVINEAFFRYHPFLLVSIHMKQRCLVGRRISVAFFASGLELSTEQRSINDYHPLYLASDSEADPKFGSNSEADFLASLTRPHHEL